MYLTDKLYFPIVEVLELLHKFDEDAHFEVVEADELEENEHAVTDIISKTIKIRADIYMKVHVTVLGVIE